MTKQCFTIHRNEIEKLLFFLENQRKKHSSLYEKLWGILHILANAGMGSIAVCTAQQQYNLQPCSNTQW